MYKYSLRKYSGADSQMTCPSCHRNRCFTPYINTDTQEIIDETVGICDHINSCGYHKTPKEFFDSQIGFISPKKSINPIRPTNTPINHAKEFTVIANDWIKMSDYFYSSPHNLFLYLYDKGFAYNDLTQCFKRMKVKSGLYNQTVYYQIDLQGNVRTAKIIPYNQNTGHRLKNENNSTNPTPISPINWLHSIYSKALGLKDFHLQQVPFGLSELIKVKDKIKPVNIYEAEKTACIMDLLFHDNAFHLSVGGVQMLNTSMLQPIKQLGINKVNLFPDKGCYQLWREKARKISNELQLQITVDNQLENTQLKDGEDLIDFLFKV